MHASSAVMARAAALIRRLVKQEKVVSILDTCRGNAGKGEEIAKVDGLQKDCFLRWVS